MPIPPNEWNIGQIFIREQKRGSRNEYQIIITMRGINIEKNGEWVLRLNSSGFVDYHISSQELVIKYDKSQNILYDIEYEHDNNQRMHILYNGGEGYGPNQLIIPIQFFSENDKNNLRALMKKVDGWKKDKYAFVYGKPKKDKNKVGNEGIIAQGRADLKWGNTGQAEKSAKDALEIYPTLDCYLLLLDVYKGMNDETSFRATCEEALRHIDNAEERAVLNEKMENSSLIKEHKYEDKKSSQPQNISKGLQNYINAMVEEIVLEGKSFDTQKKYLKKFSESEGLDYDKLESDITTFVEIMSNLQTAPNKLMEKFAEEKGKESHISDETVKKLVSHSSQREQLQQNDDIFQRILGNMVYIEGGTFQMGSSSGDDREKPVHNVTLSDFYIGKYPVTQKEWRAVMGDFGLSVGLFYGDDLPMTCFYYSSCQEFIEKLNNKLAGLLCGKKFRLPTEAEWEFAARGGNLSKGYLYAGSDNLDEVGWYEKNSQYKICPVGQKKPNELGLYDMSGNVWELCQDFYEKNYVGIAQTNPTGPANGSRHVCRGGTVYNYIQDGAFICRSTHRCEASSASEDVGFRLVLAMPNEKTIVDVDAKGWLKSVVMSPEDKTVDFHVPEGVKGIVENAFKDCTFERIFLPSSIRTIHPGVFARCNNLKRVILPENKDDWCLCPEIIAESKTIIRKGNWELDETTRHYEHFEDCYMAEGSFMGNGCLAVILPEGLTTIPSKAFDHCLNLLYVYVPDSVKKIEGGAFARCFNLLEVSLPKGVTIIPCIHEHYQEYEWRPYDEDIDRDYSYDYNTFENNSCLKYREHSLSAEEWLARITGK